MKNNPIPTPTQQRPHLLNREPMHGCAALKRLTWHLHQVAGQEQHLDEKDDYQGRHQQRVQLPDHEAHQGKHDGGDLQRAAAGKVVLLLGTCKGGGSWRMLAGALTSQVAGRNRCKLLLAAAAAVVVVNGGGSWHSPP